jgi:hypothetical protein
LSKDAPDHPVEIIMDLGKAGAGSTVWTVVLCLLGTLAVFLPWEHVQLLAHKRSYAGGRFAEGRTTMIVFVTLLLFLLPTHFIEKKVRWRAMALVVGGLAAVIALALFVFRVATASPAVERHDLVVAEEAGQALANVMRDSLGVGPFLGLAAGVGLFSLGMVTLIGQVKSPGGKGPAVAAKARRP